MMMMMMVMMMVMMIMMMMMMEAPFACGTNEVLMTRVMHCLCGLHLRQLYEDYKFSEWTEMDRRDQQPGQQRCRAFVGPEDGKLRLTGDACYNNSCTL